MMKRGSKATTTACIIVVCLFFKIPTLLSPHEEGDETVYWQLAKNVSATGEYSLSGSPILQDLSPQIYDRPLFHHPPLVIAAWVPFAWYDGKALAVVVSWLGHALTIGAVALLVRQILIEHDRKDWFAFCLPIVGIALDPVLSLTAARLWLDSMLTGLCSISIALCYVAMPHRRRSLLLLSGVCLGLALLTKITALGVVAVNFVLVARGSKNYREALVTILYGAIPALLICAPWYMAFYAEYGVLVPSWAKPDDWLLDHYPFVRMMASRPWYYYLVQLSLMTPVSVFCLSFCNGKIAQSRFFLLGIVWLVVFVGGMTYLGVKGSGFQMRYIAPAMPAIYVMLAGVWESSAARRRAWIAIAAIVYAGVTSVLVNFSSGTADLNSLIQRLLNL